MYLKPYFVVFVCVVWLKVDATPMSQEDNTGNTGDALKLSLAGRTAGTTRGFWGAVFSKLPKSAKSTIKRRKIVKMQAKGFVTKMDGSPLSKWQLSLEDNGDENHTSANHSTAVVFLVYQPEESNFLCDLYYVVWNLVRVVKYMMSNSRMLYKP